MGQMGDDEGLDSSLGLGELAQLTVNNEAEAAYDVSLRQAKIARLNLQNYKLLFAAITKAFKFKNGNFFTNMKITI
jgi:hypothetical protein